MFALVTVGAAHAQSKEIEATISDQIAAFEANQLAKAFGFASPSIQSIFQTPENFGRMVQQGYPMVWRPARVYFLDLTEKGGALYQNVMIKDQNGVLHALEYQMQDIDGIWKIAGVRLLVGQKPSV